MAGIEIEPLAKANKNEDHWSLGYFGNIEGASQKVVKKTLASLNTAFATQGLTIKITDKVVLVTGAGGSIGSELCRQILFLKPKKLILFEVSESSLYHIGQELTDLNKSFNESPKSFIGSK